MISTKGAMASAIAPFIAVSKAGVGGVDPPTKKNLVQKVFCGTAPSLMASNRVSRAPVQTTDKTSYGEYVSVFSPT